MKYYLIDERGRRVVKAPDIVLEKRAERNTGIPFIDRRSYHVLQRNWTTTEPRASDSLHFSTGRYESESYSLASLLAMFVRRHGLG